MPPKPHKDPSVPKSKGKNPKHEVSSLLEGKDKLNTDLPKLLAVLTRVNEQSAREWTVAFLKAGFTDKWFPVQNEDAMGDTCKRLKLRLTPREIELFYRLQWSYFVRAVRDGEHVIYRDKETPPYEQVPHPGLPAHGAFGEVDKVQMIADPSNVYARKRLFNFGGDYMKRIAEEVKALKNIKHEHAVPFYGSYVYHDSTYLLFELCDFNLRRFFSDPPVWFISLTTAERANKLLNWLIDLSSCISQFHRIGGIHRDLKPENILIHGDKIYVADFGLASQKPSLSSNPASIEGTECYKAPEQGQGFMYGRSADVFALGCIFLEIVTFGSNINVEWFAQFRQEHGPKTCHLSAHKCFRHNLDIVSKFSNTYFSREGAIGKVTEFITFEMLAVSQSTRPQAKAVTSSLLAIADNMSFYKKLDCCKAYRTGTRVSDPSEKSLAEKMEGLSIAEAAKVNNYGFAGQIGTDCFGV